MVVVQIEPFFACRVVHGSTGGAIEERSELFIESSPDTTVFQTNDTGLWGPYGTTLWALSGASQAPLVSREVTARKITGDDTIDFMKYRQEIAKASEFSAALAKELLGQPR